MNLKTGNKELPKQLTKEEWWDSVNYPNQERETVEMQPVDEKVEKKSKAEKKEVEK